MSTLNQKIGWARWAVRQQGVLGALRMAVGRLRRGTPKPPMVHPFDLEHGTDTSGWIEGGALRAGHRNAEFSTAYFGVPPSRMRNLLEHWRQTPGVLPIEDYTFIDIGCGKGRALLLASELPFQQAIGIELDEALAQLASRNVTRWQSMGNGCCSASVLHADALEAVLPDGPLVVYLYNPFLAPVLRALLDRLQQRQSGVDLLYLYPEQESEIIGFPAFKLLWKQGIKLSPDDIGADELSELEDPCSAYRFTPPSP